MESRLSRLKRLSAICLALPEAQRNDQNGHAAFVVRKKTFAYYLNNHHGDGIVSMACKVLPGDNALLAAASPERFYVPPYIGPRGWVALRLDTSEVDWEEVGELVSHSYRLIAREHLLPVCHKAEIRHPNISILPCVRRGLVTKSRQL